MKIISIKNIPLCISRKDSPLMKEFCIKLTNKEMNELNHNTRTVDFKDDLKFITNFLKEYLELINYTPEDMNKFEIPKFLIDDIFKVTLEDNHSFYIMIKSYNNGILNLQLT